MLPDAVQYDKLELRRERLRRFEERAFQAHAATFVIINAMLVAIWAAVGGGYFWPIWPMIGWGPAVGLHGWWTYGRGRVVD